MTTLTLEQIAAESYKAYGSVTNWKNYQGLPMPEWEALPPKIREAWSAATQRTLDIERAKLAEVVEHLDYIVKNPDDTDLHLRLMDIRDAWAKVQIKPPTT